LKRVSRKARSTLRAAQGRALIVTIKRAEGGLDGRFLQLDLRLPCIAPYQDLYANVSCPNVLHKPNASMSKKAEMTANTTGVRQR
jgi:hypothetical protein